jgi:hypothetical protein
MTSGPPSERTQITMIDKTAEAARLMKVTEAVCEELHRQWSLSFWPMVGSMWLSWSKWSSRRQTATWSRSAPAVLSDP